MNPGSPESRPTKLVIRKSVKKHGFYEKPPIIVANEREV
jgi:hypothetical protein